MGSAATCTRQGYLGLEAVQGFSIRGLRSLGFQGGERGGAVDFLGPSSRGFDDLGLSSLSFLGFASPRLKDYDGVGCNVRLFWEKGLLAGLV